MRTVVFSTKPYDRRYLDAANAAGEHQFTYLEPRLTAATVSLARGYDAVCVFVNDRLDAPVIEALAEGGVRAIALRCAGFNNVDLPAAERARIAVVRVPAYSPHAVAEHTFGLILALNRHLPRAHGRVRDGNLALDGLLGFDLAGRTMGIVGTGQIGRVVARIALGFDMQVLAADRSANSELEAQGVRYVDLDTLLAGSDIVTLHCPLTPDTHHLIDAGAIGRMRRGAMLINTSRGGLVDTRSVIAALKSGQLGRLGLDVYEEEADLFFEDLSTRVIADDVFTRLLTFPNVMVTAHQGFFTHEALQRIAETTVENLRNVERTGTSAHAVSRNKQAGA